MPRRPLYRGQPGISSAAAYTSANIYTTITAATVTNTTAGAVTLDVWRVASGGTATNANKIYDGLSVPANSVVGLPMLVAKTMGQGEALHLKASAATSLTVDIDGDV